MPEFTPDTVSAGEDAINGCLQSGGDCCLELLGESLEEREYLRQIEQVYFECGATNFRQAHFFLTIQSQIQSLEDKLSQALNANRGFLERVKTLEESVEGLWIPDPEVFGRSPDSLISRIERLERFL